MFADEISQQPTALLDLVQYYRSSEGRDRLERCAQLPGADEAATFAGMGSSLYVAQAVLPAFWQAQRRVSAVEAGEILHFGMPKWRPQGPLIAVSQSGESAETLALAERLKGIASIITVTNDPESQLAALAQVVLPIFAGEESAISTKTYTNTLGVLHLLKAAFLGEDLDEVLDQLEAASAFMTAALGDEMESSVQSAAQILDSASSVHFISRGPAMASALVGALTIGEGARVTAVALPAASFRHGPMELAGEGHASVLFMPNHSPRPLVEKLRNDLQRAGSKTVTITNEASALLPDSALEIVVGSSECEEAFFPFPTAIIVERILAAVSARRGIVPGDFRYGGKITADE